MCLPLRTLTKTLNGTDAGGSTRSILVLQLAHSPLGCEISRSIGGSTVLRSAAGVSGRHARGTEAWLLLDGRLLLDVGVGFGLVAVHILRTRQTVGERHRLSIRRRTELGRGVRCSAGLLGGTRRRWSRSGSSRGRGRSWWRRIPRKGGNLQLGQLGLPALC